MILLALAAIVFSSVFLVLLCVGDPKRRRAARVPRPGLDVRARRIIVVAALLPGLALALAGQSAAFLLWLGGSAAAGWTATLCFSSASEPAN